MTRIVGPTGSRRRRRFLFAPLVLVSALALMIVGGAQAVHDLDFQLDGDVLTSTVTNVPPGPDPPQGTQNLDWDSFFNASGDELPLPSAAWTASAFELDFLTNPNGSFNTEDNTTYATGSKDTLPITGGWECNHDANVNSKIDIMNSYSAAYTDPVTDDDILYFAIERNANTGDANVGFWFLQSDVSCETTSGTEAFVGNHKDGDLLIVSAFTNGGAVSTIDVYRWNIPNPAVDPVGSLGTTPVAHGVDCRDPATGTGDTACAVANTESITTPWLTAATSIKPNPVGHTLPTAQFFEGGLNLTQSGLGGKCFNTFIGDTRSSQSLTATLFDFALGQLGECVTTLTTTAGLNATGTDIASGNGANSGTASSGIDNATLTITGADEWAGTLKYYLCGPFASPAVCTSGGVLVSTVNVDETTAQPIPSGNGTTTGIATLTSAGRYCWFAEFTPDADTAAKGVSGDTDDGSGSTPNVECFTVRPVTPTLDTLAGTSPVDLGQAVMDTATLGGAAKEPGNNGANATYNTINATNGAFVGTIGFTLKGPDTLGPPFVCSTTNATAFPGETQTFPITLPVPPPITGNGAYGPVSFKPGAPGQYHWVATYSHTAATVNNVLPVTHNAGCTDGDENVTIRQIPTEIRTKQDWIPNDTAEIKATIGNLAAGGTVVFSLYDNATCTGTAKYTESKTLAGGGPTEEVSTGNTGTGAGMFRITTGYADPAPSTAGPYSWKVVYTPAAADTAHTGKQSSCDAEHFDIDYTNDPGPGNDLP